jgi:glycosyltransferase involved in cell wall biosynthesis
VRITFLSNANSIHLQEWAAYFAEDLKHDVTVLSIPVPRMRYPDSVRVVGVASERAQPKALWPLAIPAIRREHRRRAGGVFVAYRVVSYGFLAALAGVRPLILAAQGGDLVWPPGDRLGEFCVRFACRRAAHFNAWSPNIRDELIRYGADASRIQTVSRGIDLSLFPAMPKKRAEAPIIAMTRSLLPSYNTMDLVEAMAHVASRRPDVRAIVAGEGSERARLETRARDLGLLERNVLFVGRLSRAEVVDLLVRATVYCSTTLTDGLPLSHFEAMAAGCFPVCSDISANRVWIRDGENGFLVPLRQPDRLGDALIRALESPALRARAAAANRDLVERDFDRSVNMRRIESAWTDLARRTSEIRHADAAGSASS